MKTILTLIICSGLFWYWHSGVNEKETKKNITPAKDSIDFRTTIQPIFQKNCSPCHFRGGKLYAKLPFDKGETIINHETGIFKRIKKEDEEMLIKKFIEENKKAN